MPVFRKNAKSQLFHYFIHYYYSNENHKIFIENNGAKSLTHYDESL